MKKKKEKYEETNGENGGKIVEKNMKKKTGKKFKTSENLPKKEGENARKWWDKS